MYYFIPTSFEAKTANNLAHFHLAHIAESQLIANPFLKGNVNVFEKNLVGWGIGYTFAVAFEQMAG
jgi:hypothetical protein